MPRPVVAVSPAWWVRARPSQSLQPSPMPRLWLALRALELAGPPVRRFEIPCPYSWMMIPLSKELSRSGLGPVQIYICMRGLLPSGGVAKLALLVPDPSWESASTGSLA